MATNQFSITCPSDCTITWGGYTAVNAECPGTPKRSEINRIYLRHPVDGVGLTDWTDAAEWATAVDPTNTDNTKLKVLEVVGSLPAEDRTVIPMTNGVEVFGEGVFTLTAELKSFSAGMRDWLRQLQCGVAIPYLYFTTRGGKMNGKNGAQGGIKLKSINVSLPLESGADAYEGGIIIMTWEAQTAVDQIDSPI